MDANLHGDPIQPALHFLRFAVELDRSMPRPWDDDIIEDAWRQHCPIERDVRRRMPESFTVDGWPRLMRVEHAAAYCGEKSVHTFRRAVGTLYPRPLKVPGKGERWLKDQLDQAIDRLTGRDDGPSLADILD